MHRLSIFYVDGAFWDTWMISYMFWDLETV